MIKYLLGSMLYSQIMCFNTYNQTDDHLSIFRNINVFFFFMYFFLASEKSAKVIVKLKQLFINGD